MEQFPNTLSIEGNIGSGKTTLAKLISNHFNYQLIKEEFTENPFLPKFFENHSEYAFQMECNFLMDRYNQLHEWSESNQWVSDYAFCKTEAYANQNLTSEEMDLFQRIQAAVFQNNQDVDCIVYLQVSPEKAKRQIIQRGREFELDTPLEYLNNIDLNYQSYLRQHFSDRTIFIQTEDLDFVKNKNDFETIIETIQNEWTNRIQKKQ